MDISPSIESSLFLSPTAVVPLGLCAHSVSLGQSKQQARAILHAQHTHTQLRRQHLNHPIFTHSLWNNISRIVSAIFSECFISQFIYFLPPTIFSLTFLLFPFKLSSVFHPY